MAHLLRWEIAVLTSCSLLVVPLSAAAQEVTPTTTITAVCMASPPSDNPAIPGIVIVVPSDQASAMAARGFTAQTCPPNPDDFTNYRTKICALAANATPLMQEQIAKSYKATPTELCDLANRIAQ